MPSDDDYRRAIAAIPEGRVAAYSTVSEAVRGDANASQKVAGLTSRDRELVATAYRVVRKDGAVAAGFRWSDGRRGNADDVRRTLEKEGVSFTADGRVRPECMLTIAELRTLYEQR
jgi:alkylated DNA nucleotide flippase Atl1